MLINTDNAAATRKNAFCCLCWCAALMALTQLSSKHRKSLSTGERRGILLGGAGEGPQVVAPVAVTCWKCSTAFPAGKLSANYYKKWWMRRNAPGKKQRKSIGYILSPIHSNLIEWSRLSWRCAWRRSPSAPSHYAFMIIIEIHENLRTINNFWGVTQPRWLGCFYCSPAMLLSPLLGNIICAELANPQNLTRGRKECTGCSASLCIVQQVAALSVAAKVDCWLTHWTFVSLANRQINTPKRRAGERERERQGEEDELSN